VTTDQQPTSTDTPADLRFSISLYAEVVSVMERHGYVQPTEQSAKNRSTGATVEALLNLTRVFEGVAR